MMTPEQKRIKIADSPRYKKFMAKVEILQSGCWMWKGSQSGSGYGQFWDGERAIPAHWFLLQERPAKGFEACHKCDVKLCVNPSHIFIGTRADNMRDCVSKGRHKPQNGCAAMLKVRKPKLGSSNHSSKLTEAQAMEAKNCPMKYGAATALAKKFGVSLTVISDIRAGKRWTHLKSQRADAFLLTHGVEI